MIMNAQDVRIRIAEPADASRITPLCAEHAVYERAQFNDYGHGGRLAGLMHGPSPRITIFVAECGDQELIGYASVARELSTWRAEEYLHMDCLYVRERYRGNKIGRLLFNAVGHFARSQGILEIQWQTPDWNDGAIRFYRSVGATPAAKMRFTIGT